MDRVTDHGASVQIIGKHPASGYSGVIVGGANDFLHVKMDRDRDEVCEVKPSDLKYFVPPKPNSSVKYVYLAGPMSKGFLIDHVRAAMTAGNKIREHGGVPFLPQISILWELHTHFDYEDWMAQDFAWIERCDALVRLPGESSGADREVAFAKGLGKPVFYTLERYLEALREDRISAAVEHVVRSVR